MRTAAVVLLAVLVALLAGGPLAGAEDAPLAEVLFERESVQAKLSPHGDVKQARLYTQLTMAGDGRRTVVDPTATKNLRNLEGFGKPSLTDAGAKWRVELSGRTSMRTVADYGSRLPLDIGVSYLLNGEPIEADELVGRSGDLTVTFRLRNVSAVPTELRYKDSRGNFTTETVDIPLPLAGTFSSTLGPSFAHVETDTGIVAGDGRGNTKLSWSLIMFEPVGANEAELTYSAVVTDAKVPAATVQVVPVQVNQTPLASGNAAYTDAADSTFELAQGATTIDRNVLLLATGAGQLLDGLIKLADGAEELNAGLDRAATGSGELAAGLAKADGGGAELATGLVTLRDGAGKLSTGLGSARQGGGELADGLGKLEDGSSRLADGLGSATAGGAKLADGLGQLADGSAELSDGLSSANAGGAKLADGAEQVAGGAASATAGAGELLAGMKQIEAGLVTLDESMPGAVAGADKLLAGVRELRAALGAVGKKDTVLDGLAKLETGLPDAKAGIRQIQGILTQASAGLAGLAALREGQATALQTGWDAVCVPDPTVNPLCGAVGAGLSTNSQMAGALTGVTAAVSGSNGGLGTLATRLGEAAAGASRLYDGVSTIARKVESGRAADPGLVEGLTALVKGLTEAAAGVTQLSDGTQKAVAGQATLRIGLEDLTDGAGQVAAGTQTLSGGLGELDAGGQSLAAGAGEAASGGAELADGLGLLSAGGEELAAGTGTAAAGAGELFGGLAQLDDGGRELAAGADKAAAGAGELSSGLGQLNAGAAELSSGLGDAAEGSGTLAEGLVSAKIGGARVSDGATKLSAQGTSVLASSVDEAHAEQNRNVAMIKALDERSRTSGMPVGAVDGATASAVYSFELAAADGAGSQNLLRVLLAVLALGALAGLALRRRIPPPAPRGGRRAARVMTAALK